MKTSLRMTALALLLAVSTTSVGCYGSFALTRLVYDFNGDISGNKFVRWIAFVVMAGILPVYEIAILADVVILNTIEFWTGSSLMAEQGAKSEKEIALGDGRVLHLQRESPEAMTMTLREGEIHTTRRIELRATGVEVRDEKGARVVTTRLFEDVLEVVDARGIVVARYDAQRQQAIAAALETADVTALKAELDRTRQVLACR